MHFDGWGFFGMHAFWWLFWIVLILALFGLFEPVPIAYAFGEENRDRYWKVFEALRIELGYADYLGALQCYRVGALNDPRLLSMSSFLVVFQLRKVQRLGLWDAVDGRVLIYLHKEQVLDAIEQRYPARHYVMVDDKLRITRHRPLLMINAYWQELTFQIQEGTTNAWRRVVDTSRESPFDFLEPGKESSLHSMHYRVSARAVVVLVRDNNGS